MALLLMIFLVSLPITFYFLVMQLLKSKNKAKTTSSGGLLPPGPPGLPIIGNLHQLENTNLHYQLWNLSKQYGPLMSLRLGLVQTVVVSTVKMAKEVLKTHDLEFSSRPALVGQQKLTYNGLDVAFAPYNDYWKEMRKIFVTHLSNSNRVHHFRPVREAEVAAMIQKISESSAEAGEATNLSEVLMTLTNSVICRVAFGKKFENRAGERSKFHSILDETRVVLGAFYFKDFFPFMGDWIDKLSGILRRLENNFKQFDTFYQQLIEEHADPNRPKDQIQGDIIDVLLQVQKDREQTDEIHEFTYDNIKGVLMNVFVGATDTSAATMAWAMTNVMRNQKVMKKAQKEVRDLIGNKGFVDEDDLLRLPYIKAILKETFRMYPPGPIIPRETTKSCTIDGYEIPAKTLVYINAWAIARDPEVWKSPDEFDPDRYINGGDHSHIELTGQNYEMIPFGGGRRFCPGIHMGLATLELAIANLVYSFDWEMPDGMKVEDLDFDIAQGIVMHKKIPLRLVATKHI